MVYAIYEVKQEAHLTTLVVPDTDPFDRSKGSCRIGKGEKEV